MRIATWNVARCRPQSVRAARVTEWMRSVGADVWVLTETHRGLSPGPGYTLIASSADAPDRDAARGECWVAVWSRLPARPLDLSSDRERSAAIRLNTEDVVVVGTVLPWLTDARRPGLRGEEAFLAGLGEQLADWKRFRQDTSCGLCVAGDFNQDLLTTGHYYGSSGGRLALRTALRECGLDCWTGGIDDPLAPSGLACIDHIAVAGLESAGMPRSTAWPEAGTLRKTLSDHYGVWIEAAHPNTPPPVVPQPTPPRRGRVIQRTE